MWHYRHKSHSMKFLLDLSLRLLIETLTGDFEKLKWILITPPRPSEINKWEKLEHMGEAIFDIPSHSAIICGIGLNWLR